MNAPFGPDAGNMSHVALESPLDPFVDRVVRWIAEMESGISAAGLAAAIAAAFDWPLAFAEVVLAGVNGRRLLRQNQMSTRPMRMLLSRRGEIWLDEHPKPS